jgi:hypothetical protein
VLPSKPAQVLAIGSSMGGLVSALEDQDSQGRIDGAADHVRHRRRRDQPQ